MSPTKPWDLYANQLMLNGFGHPLWLPEPTSREILLGDVGFINKGEFVPLFNSQKPAGDPINVERGVPDDFNMFAPNRSWNHKPRKVLMQPIVSSGSIVIKNVEGNIEAAISDKASVRLGWSFQTKSNAGAMVVLEPPGIAEELWSKRHIIDYMCDNLKSWLRFANSKQEGWALELLEEEIMFVSGTLKTTQWAVAAFEGDTFRGKQGHVSAQIGSLASAGISFSIEDSFLPSAYYRNGPSSDDPAPVSATVLDTADTTSARRKPDQCLFIHYYKMKRRKFWRNRIVAGAGPHQLPPGDRRNEGNPDMGAWPTPNEDERDAYDPVSILLDYILEHSKAKIAVASTWDLVDIFPLTGEFPDDIREAIAIIAPRVDVDGNGVGTVVTRDFLEESLSTNTQPEKTRGHMSQPSVSKGAVVEQHKTVVERMEREGEQRDVLPLTLLHPSMIYASQLFPQGLGYPIWEPEPKSAGGEINLGDVGWLQDGSFSQLFNARIEKAADQFRQEVPEKYVPFNPPSLFIRGPVISTAEPPICPDSMRITETGPTEFSFTCSKRAGAFLMFSPKAIETEIQSKRHIIEYMKQHFGHWMDYANNRYGLSLKEQDVIFVSGTMKTSRWALAALQEIYRNQSGTVKADLRPETAPPVLEVTFATRQIPKSFRKVGPSRGLDGEKGSKEERNDQCIFIHYYQMKRRLWIPNPIKAAAGPNELPPSGPDESDTAVGVEDGDKCTKAINTWNPVNDLLNYILNNSKASTAIASDMDVYALFKDREFPSDISAALEELRPVIVIDEDGVGTAAVDFPSVEKDQLGQSAESTPYNPEDHARGEKNAVHEGSITALAYSLNGKYAASGSEDTTAIIWDVHSEHMVHQLAPHRDTILALAFSRDNELLASSNDNGVILWDVDSGKETRRLETHAAVHSLTFSPDGSQLVAGTYDGSVLVWDTATYVDPVNLSKHIAVVTFAVFCADGRSMATGGTESECYVWDMGTLQLKTVLRGHQGMVCAAAFAPDGERIVTASDDYTSRLWETETGKTLFTLMEHSGPVWTVAFSPDGRRVATGSSDLTVKVWNAHSGEHQRTLVGHSDMVNVVEFSPDGKYLASAAVDHTVRLWKAEDGSAVTTFKEHGDNVTAVAFSPDGTTIASGAHDGTVHIRPLEWRSL